MKLSSKIDKMVGNRNSQLNKKVAMYALRKVKQLTPVDTGALRNSWQVAIKGNKVILYNNMEYAPYIEFGRITKDGRFIEGKHMLSDTKRLTEDYFRSQGINIRGKIK